MQKVGVKQYFFTCQKSWRSTGRAHVAPRTTGRAVDPILPRSMPLINNSNKHTKLEQMYLNVISFGSRMVWYSRV